MNKDKFEKALEQYIEGKGSFKAKLHTKRILTEPIFSKKTMQFIKNQKEAFKKQYSSKLLHILVRHRYFLLYVFNFVSFGILYNLFELQVFSHLNPFIIILIFIGFFILNVIFFFCFSYLRFYYINSKLIDLEFIKANIIDYNSSNRNSKEIPILQSFNLFDVFSSKENTEYKFIENIKSLFEITDYDCYLKFSKNLDSYNQIDHFILLTPPKKELVMMEREVFYKGISFKAHRCSYAHFMKLEHVQIPILMYVYPNTFNFFLYSKGIIS